MSRSSRPACGCCASPLATPHDHATSQRANPNWRSTPPISEPDRRVCIRPMQLPGKPVRRAYWPSYACRGPGTSFGVSRQLPGPRRACWLSDSSDTTSPAGGGTPAGRCAARESRQPKVAVNADQPRASCSCPLHQSPAGPAAGSARRRPARARPRDERPVVMGQFIGRPAPSFWRLAGILAAGKRRRAGWSHGQPRSRIGATTASVTTMCAGAQTSQPM
jgi:hypothetical protein